MADEMVLKTQEWLNSTYKGKTGYTEIAENGNTGWNTIYALRKALQIELGITATSNNFGPSTTAKFNERFPNGVFQQDPNDDIEDNIYGIIQGACWCKGYSTGASRITRNFYSGTGKAIRQLKSSAGCSDSSSTVTLNVMKALLSMDQFRLVSGGTSKIQEIQRNLNNEYEDYIGLSPCDGLYGREMNKALIKVLQAIEGYSVSAATGTFGDGTKANLPIVPSSGTISTEKEAKAIKLVRYALCCNGYDISTDSSVWDTDLQNKIKEFQDDLCIQNVNKCNVDTWMALLLSKGNPDRNCIACDTRFEMTESILNYLKNNGYQIVGRYLTGGNFKELRVGEPKRILNAGLKFFPIFQESTTKLEYFTEAKGKQDAKNAVKAARKHGIEAGQVIYFAVDTDPTDAQISTYILPYFKSLYENIGTSYKVGVYGTRNVCTQLMNKKYVETCFVSDMSTGFSGNMGFKMPNNWNFDQFHEIKEIKVGNESFDLDKVAYSGKYPAVDSVYDKINDYLLMVESVEDYYLQYKQSKNETCTHIELVLGVTNCLRSFRYSEPKWTVATLAEIDNEFIEYLTNNNQTLYNELYKYSHTDENLLVDQYGGFLDVCHLAATIEGYVSPKSIAPAYWFGWGGDLATLMKNVKKASEDEIITVISENKKDEILEYNKSIYLKYAKILLGNDSSSFSYADICSDADSIKIADKINEIISSTSTTNHPVSIVMSQYYANEVQTRISNFLNDLSVTVYDLETLKSKIWDKMTGIDGDPLVLALGVTNNELLLECCCEAFAQYIIDNK